VHRHESGQAFRKRPLFCRTKMRHLYAY
jgi:hypothetical protein